MKLDTKNFFQFIISPHKQFNRLVIFVMLVIFLMIAAHVYIYRLEQDTIMAKNDQAVSQSLPTINSGKLDSVLSRFSKRVEGQKTAQAVSPAVVDPSR